MNRNGLDEFKEVISDYRSALAYVLGGTVALPLADYLVKIGPPWPPWIAVLTSCAELLVMIAVFQHVYGLAAAKARRVTSGLIALSAVSSVVFLGLSSALVESYDSGRVRVVTGFLVRAETERTLEAVRKTNPSYNEKDALQGSEYDPKRVWQSWTVDVARVAVCSVWLVLFCAISGAVASFVVAQRSRKQRRTTKATDPPAASPASPRQ